MVADKQGGIMNIGLAVGVIGVMALLFFQEYFFGPKDTDDKQGFPWSRRKRP
jgi:hypothetical protein